MDRLIGLPGRLDWVAAWRRPSTWALLAANAVPLAGVLFLGWRPGAALAVFWAENLVIGGYTLARLLIACRGWMLILPPFFVVHFGLFTLGHGVACYLLIVTMETASGRGRMHGDLLSPIGLAPAEAAVALGALVLSHGVSFVGNFLRQPKRLRPEPMAIMEAPYPRVVLMHALVLVAFFALFAALALFGPEGLYAPLAAFVLIKTAADLAAHAREHGARRVGPDGERIR